jgi:hypothetical protein
MHWLVDPAHSAEVSGYSLLLGVVATVLTLLGLFATYRQAVQAKRSARDAETAVKECRFRASQYDAYRDLSQASYALEMTKRHLNNNGWRDASETYEDARQAIIRMQHAVEQLAPTDAAALSKMTGHMANFCNAVDAALSGKGNYPDKFKVLATIRRNYEVIVSVQRSLQDGAQL